MTTGDLRVVPAVDFAVTVVIQIPDVIRVSAVGVRRFDELVLLMTHSDTNAPFPAAPRV